MKPKYSVLLFIIAISTIRAMAQSEADALRYSQSSISGTARFSSMAGAFGALGGDFSSIAVNPAGLGIYRKSEFTISSSIYTSQTTTDFLGKTATENKFNFNIPNFGFAFTHLTNADRKDLQGWKSVTFGIGMTRINNFHTHSFYESLNPDNSLLNHFVENANNSTSLDGFYEQLAYDAGLIYPENDSSDIFTSDMGSAGTYPITQRRSSTARGGINEWDISLGANYNNIVYLGASLGISSIRYLEESIYTEEDKDNIIPVLNKYSLQQDVTTSGTGVNLKLGVIVRPAPWVRIGASFHTPTLYASMRDDYKNIITSSLENIPTSPAESPDGTYQYTMITPLKAIGSVAFIIGKAGLISADYEFVDYSGSRFDADDASFSAVNDAIRTKYTSTGNFRIGGEYRWNAISFRGGYGLYGSPFNSNEKTVGADYSKTYYAGGIGIRDKNYFIDLGYNYSESNEYYQPYTLLNNVSVAGSKNNLVNHNFVVTFGVKF
ncbi:outer membrane protein transport protein [soil metagenome]